MKKKYEVIIRNTDSNTEKILETHSVLRYAKEAANSLRYSLDAMRIRERKRAIVNKTADFSKLFELEDPSFSIVVVKVENNKRTDVHTAHSFNWAESERSWLNDRNTMKQTLILDCESLLVSPYDLMPLKMLSFSYEPWPEPGIPKNDKKLVLKTYHSETEDER